MDWYVIRHPEIERPGLVAETALDHYKVRGWMRVSEPISDMDRHHVDLAGYAGSPDLDAGPESAPKTEPTGSKAAAKTSKEN